MRRIEYASRSKRRVDGDGRSGVGLFGNDDRSVVEHRANGRQPAIEGDGHSFGDDFPAVGHRSRARTFADGRGRFGTYRQRLEPRRPFD